MENQKSLTQYLVDDGYLKTPEIIAAFEAIDRADFVADEYRNRAYENVALTIGLGQTISQPLTVAFMLELLHPKCGDRILDIGFGSGWTAALLAHITGNNSCKISNSQPMSVGGQGMIFNKKKWNEGSNRGLVVAVERIKELKEFGEKNISKYNFIDSGIVKCVLGDGSKGYKKDAPYDKIIAGAASEGDVPQQWKKQLKIGGRIVAPVSNSIVSIDKISKSKYNKKEYFGFSFVPLITDN